ncbi:72_t:CDS:2 [Cetraspora pellucida]|uniref:72_t:CDS:1 n=1 Tax=Cetraspora pellucida TaxID=1433469 RepID=A0A9N8VMY9_9GLOM|nr:72_t:CDS:2 [Cetraspora pellucida]
MHMDPLASQVISDDSKLVKQLKGNLKKAFEKPARQMKPNLCQGLKKCVKNSYQVSSVASTRIYRQKNLFMMELGKTEDEIASVFPVSPALSVTSQMPVLSPINTHSDEDDSTDSVNLEQTQSAISPKPNSDNNPEKVFECCFFERTAPTKLAGISTMLTDLGYSQAAPSM